MKNTLMILGLMGVALLCITPRAAAQDSELPQTFQRGDTYIRYHLLPDALSEHSLDPTATATSLSIEQQTIGAIDAYFELIPAPQHEQGPRFLYAATWSEEHSQGMAIEPIDAVTIRNLLASWKIGNLALSLDYDRSSSYTTSTYLLHDTHWVQGAVTAPLGESGFSLGARLGMYSANELEQNRRIPLFASQSATEPVLVMVTESDGTAGQAGFATTSAMVDDQDASLTRVQHGLSANAVAGAVNVSGAVKGVNVFTEVGFAALPENAMIITTSEGSLSNFYAHGGASYRIGEVTLGLEAGFENGENLMEQLSEDSLGFEHDFLIDDLLASPAKGFQKTNKVYATVSASMSPTERMMIEGAFSYIQPLDVNTFPENFGVEVNGAFQYSLTNYLNYLVEAGMTSHSDPLEENQYKVINSLEFSF